MLSRNMQNTAKYIRCLHHAAKGGQEIIFSPVALRQLSEILEQAARDAAALERNIVHQPMLVAGADTTNVIHFPERGDISC